MSDIRLNVDIDYPKCIASLVLTFTFSHLADALIQSDLQQVQGHSLLEKSRARLSQHVDHTDWKWIMMMMMMMMCPVVVEGLALLDLGVSPYSGDVFHEVSVPFLQCCFTRQ